MDGPGGLGGKKKGKGESSQLPSIYGNLGENVFKKGKRGRPKMIDHAHQP